MAVNSFDLDRCDPLLRVPLVKGKLDLTAPVWVDRNKTDEYAWVFCCDLLTAAMVCDILRSHDRKVGDPPSRMYLFRRTWSKLGRNAVLTSKSGLRRILNPAVFPPDLVPVPSRPKAVEVVTFGS